MSSSYFWFVCLREMLSWNNPSSWLWGKRKLSSPPPDNEKNVMNYKRWSNSPPLFYLVLLPLTDNIETCVVMNAVFVLIVQMEVATVGCGWKVQILVRLRPWRCSWSRIVVCVSRTALGTSYNCYQSALLYQVSHNLFVVFYTVGQLSLVLFAATN